MPTDTFTADALAIRDAGGPWPFSDLYAGSLQRRRASMKPERKAAYLCVCVEWLVGRDCVIRRWDEFVVKRYNAEAGRMEYHTAPTLPEAIIAAVKAELGIK